MKHFLKKTADTMIDTVTRIADYISANDHTRQSRKGLPSFGQFLLGISSFIGSFFLLSTLAERSFTANPKAIHPDPNGTAFKSASALVDNIKATAQAPAPDLTKLRALSVQFHDVVLLDKRLSDRQVVDLFEQLPNSSKNLIGRYTVHTPVLTGGIKDEEGFFINAKALKAGRHACLISHDLYGSHSTEDFNACMAKHQDSPFETLVVPMAQSIAVTSGLALGSFGLASIYRRRLQQKSTLKT